MGLVADRAGGLGDVVGSEGFQHADGEVAEPCHRAGCAASADAGSGLGEGYVSHVVQALDLPVPADQFGDPFRGGLLGSETGAAAFDLDGLHGVRRVAVVRGGCRVHDVAGEVAGVDQAGGDGFRAVFQVFQEGTDLLDQGSCLVLADAEEVGDQRGGQATLVENGAPDDVLGGELAVPGPLPGRQAIEEVADGDCDPVQIVAFQAGQEGMGGQSRAKGMCVAGMGSAAGRVEGNVGDARLGRDGVVPLAVEVLQVDREGGCVLLADLDSGGVAAGVQAGSDGQSGAGSGRRDQVQRSLVAGQRVGAPVEGDEGEPVVKSARGAVSSFDRAVSPDPLPAPGVPLSRHRALHKSRSTMDSCLHSVVGQGEGTTVTRYR